VVERFGGYPNGVFRERRSLGFQRILEASVAPGNFNIARKQNTTG
jgi:hypothetical protein